MDWIDGQEADEGEGALWTDDDSMADFNSDDDTEDPVFDHWSKMLYVTRDIDPQVKLLHALQSPAPGVPPQQRLFPWQPTTCLYVRGAASHLKSGLASFPLASVSYHYQTADALAIVPPPAPAAATHTGSVFEWPAAAPCKTEGSGMEVLLGDAKALMVVQFKPWAVETQLRAHQSRLQAAHAYVETLHAEEKHEVQGLSPASKDAVRACATHEADGAAAAAAAAAAADFDAADATDAVPGAASQAAAAPATAGAGSCPRDMGYEVVCKVDLGYNHYSVATSPDGRFIAACGNKGRVSLFAYIRGSAAACAKPKLLLLATLSTCMEDVSDSKMNNCVRFGSFAGHIRLIVTSQEHGVYFFALPAWPANGDEVVMNKAGTERITVAEQVLSRTSAHDLLVRDVRPWGEGTGTVSTAAMAAAPCTPVRAPTEGAAARHAAAGAGGGGGDSRGQRCSRRPTLCLEVVLQGCTVLQQAAGALSRPHSIHTQGLTGFPKPPNCCEPSPDGRWLAVTLDASFLLLVPSCVRYWQRTPIAIRLPSTKLRMVCHLLRSGKEGRRQQRQQQQCQVEDPQLLPGCFPAEGPVEHCPNVEPLYAYNDDLPPACQYCRFSPDGVHLAATSDSLKTLYVWKLPVDDVNATAEDDSLGVGPCKPSTRPSTSMASASDAARLPRLAAEPQLLFMVRARRPLLALSWCPWDGHQLVVAEERHAFFMLDVRCPGASLRHAVCPPVSTVHIVAQTEVMYPPRWPRINGLALGPSGEILLATPTVLFAAQAITQWDRRLHGLGHLASGLPRAFYSAVRQLLLGSHTVVRGQAPSERLPEAADTDAEAGLEAEAAKASQVQRNRAGPCRLPHPAAKRVPPAAAGGTAMCASSSSLPTTLATSNNNTETTLGAAAAAAADGSDRQALTQRQQQQQRCLLPLLPPDVLELIISMAALPQWEWEPALPQAWLPETRDSGFADQLPLEQLSRDSSTMPVELAHLLLSDEEICSLMAKGWPCIGGLILQNKARTAAALAAQAPRDPPLLCEAQPSQLPPPPTPPKQQPQPLELLPPHVIAAMSCPSDPASLQQLHQQQQQQQQRHTGPSLPSYLYRAVTLPAQSTYRNSISPHVLHVIFPAGLVQDK